MGKKTSVLSKKSYKFLEYFKIDIQDLLVIYDDMDLDVLTNLLQSYTSQPSMDGPVQNILTSMGMAIPPSKEK